MHALFPEKWTKMLKNALSHNPKESQKKKSKISPFIWVRIKS